MPLFSNSDAAPPLRGLDKAPKGKDEILSLVKNAFNYSAAHRKDLDYRVKETMHFLASDQWLRWDVTRGRFSRYRGTDWVPEPVNNVLIKNYDRLLDILVSGELRPQVTSATRDQADIDAAMAADRSVTSEFNRLKTLSKCYLPAAQWLLVAGNCFLSASWDANAGRKILLPRYETREQGMVEAKAVCQGCGFAENLYVATERCPHCNGAMVEKDMPVLDQAGRQRTNSIESEVYGEDGQQAYDEIEVGEVVESVINPFHFYPQPCSELEKARWVEEVEVMDVDEVKAIFGSKAAKVKPEEIDSDEWSTLFPSSLQRLNDRKAESNSIPVHYFRHVPDKRWPKGALYITAGKEVLHSGKALDSHDGRICPSIYVHIKYRELPGVFWGVGPIADAIPGQKRINGIDSFMILNRKQNAAHQWLWPKGAGDVNQCSGKPGAKIVYDPSQTGGLKPERLIGAPVSQQIQAEYKDTLLAIDEITGIREVLQGSIPPGPETGAAVEAIQEQAFRRFGPVIIRWLAGLQQHEENKLILIHDNWEEERLVKVLGENEDTEAYYYKGADLRHARDMNMVMIRGNDFSQTARRQRIFRAAELQLVDLADPRVRGKLLEKLDIEGFDETYLNDAKKARRVLRLLRDGKEAPPMLAEIDNHIIQYSVLREYILTVEFERLSDGTQQAILQRAAQHQQLLQAKQTQALQAAEAAKGTSPEISEAVAKTGALGGPVPTTQAGA